MAEITTTSYDEVLDVNARGTFFVTSEAAKRMIAQEELSVTGRNGTRNIGRGSIVILSSASALWPLPGGTPYNTSKHAAIGITRSASKQTTHMQERILDSSVFLSSRF